MKRKPKQILRAVLLSAIASMFGTSANAEEVIMPTISGTDENESKEIESSSNRVYKNVLKMSPSGNVVAVDSHRSHSSHSSHRSGSYVRNHSSHTSHTSHSSSSGSYSTPTRSRSTSTRSTSTRSTGTSTTGTSSRSYGYGSGTTGTTSTSRSAGTISGLYSPTPKPVDPKTVELGERTMSLNLYGNDISKLVQLLVEKLYLRDSWVSKKEGFMLYDSVVEGAVKHFQKDAGLSQSGQLEYSSLQTLKTWDKEKTTMTLGVRDLYYVEGLPMSGYDVDELVTLLWEKGLTPDPSKIEKRNGHSVFTADIEMAVKLYQAYNNLPDTGRVDEAFVKSIKGQQ